MSAFLFCACGESVIMHMEQGKGSCLKPGCGCQFFIQPNVISVDFAKEGEEKSVFYRPDDEVRKRVIDFDRNLQDLAFGESQKSKEEE